MKPLSECLYRMFFFFEGIATLTQFNESKYEYIQ